MNDESPSTSIPSPTSATGPTVDQVKAALRRV
jgi:hypothetical protein